MRDLILAAVASGHIEDLKPALELNGTAPDFGSGTAGDAIAALATQSEDGQGRSVLAALAEVLDVEPAALPLGRDLENNLVYVWPYLAERDLSSLTAAEEIDALRLFGSSKLKEMREKKRWMWWRLKIGADGSWLSFRMEN